MSRNERSDLVELKLYLDSNGKDIMEGPEEKINLLEVIFDSMDKAMQANCNSDFSCLRYNLNTLLKNVAVEEILNILKRHEATCDCSISNALTHDDFMIEIVNTVNKITSNEVNFDA